jgi:hypothetical protein
MLEEKSGPKKATNHFSLITDHRISRAGGIRTHDLLNPIQAATICNSFAEKELQMSLPFQLYQIGRFY